MGLTTALNSSISSLRVNQEALGVISGNIANANSENYTRQVIIQSAEVLNGASSGVQIDGIDRIVDNFLAESARRQVSNVGKAESIDKYFDRISLFVGQPGEDNSLNAYVDNFFTSLSDLANNPDVASLRRSALDQGVILANKISELAGNLENVRFNIDQEISNNVSSINTLLADISSLNTSIREAKRIGGNSNALLDKRDGLLTEITKIVDVQTTFNDFGEVSLSFNGGEILSPGQTFSLQYAGAGSAESFAVDSPIGAITVVEFDFQGNPVGTPRVIVSSSTDTPPLTPVFNSGALKGLLEMRDEEIPLITAQLDELAVNIKDSFNAIHNKGAGFPPPTKLTGVNAFTIDQNFAFGGDVRVGLVNLDGTPVSDAFGSGGLPPLTIPLSQYTGANGLGRMNSQEFIQEFNNYYGSPPTEIVTQGPFRDIDIAAISSNISSVEATGNIAFVGNAGVGDTIDIDGTTFTFVANGTASGATTIELGLTLGETIDEVVTVLNNSTLGTVASATYSQNAAGDTLIVTHDTSGTAPNGVYTLDADVTNGGGTANINGVGAGANPAASALGLGTGTAGVNANSAFQFDLELSNHTGGDATVEILEVLIDGNPTGQTMAASTVVAGERTRTGYNGQSISVTLPGTQGEGGSNTLSVQVRTTDSAGIQTIATIDYVIDIPDPSTDIQNDRYGFNIISAGVANIVAQNNNDAFAVARFVDANGIKILETDTLTEGFLEIETDKGSYGIVFDELNSAELGEAGVAATATNKGFSNFFGLNDFFVSSRTTKGSAYNLKVRDEFKDDPSKLATGSLSLSNQPTTVGSSPVYTYELGLGSNQTVTELAALRTASIEFSPAGSLPQLNLSFVQYTAEILSNTVVNSNIAATNIEQENLLFTTFTDRIDSASGVNIDEELANTIIYQNNYTASARLVSIVSELFDSLINTF